MASRGAFHTLMRFCRGFQGCFNNPEAILELNYGCDRLTDCIWSRLHCWFRAGFQLYNELSIKIDIKISTQLISCLVASDTALLVSMRNWDSFLKTYKVTARSFLITLTKIQGDWQMSRCNPDTGNQHFPSELWPGNYCTSWSRNAIWKLIWL